MYHVSWAKRSFEGNIADGLHVGCAFRLSALPCIAHSTYLSSTSHPHNSRISISPFSATILTMPFLESLQDGLDRILPRKKGVVSKSMSGGIGNNVGIVRYQDDVRFPPAPFFFTRSCSGVAALQSGWSSQSILISTSFPTWFT